MDDRHAKAKLRRERFAHEYLIDFNGTAAYRRAGYTATGDNAAAASAWKLLQHEDVRDILLGTQRKILAKIDLTAERLVLEAAAIAFCDPGSIFDNNFQIRPLGEWPLETRRAVASIKRNADGSIEVKFWNKNAGHELLFKHLGLLKDQPPPAQWNLDPATLAKLTDEELENAIQLAKKLNGQ